MKEMIFNDVYFMQQALREAHKAFEEDEVPIGAVVVADNKIISRGYNQTEKLNDSTAHAEMIALTSAFNYLGAKYLPNATLYVTVEPCLMCCGALYWSKIEKIVYGASDEKSGGLRFFTDKEGLIIPEKWPFHKKTQLVKGVMADECAMLMKTFFKAKR
ncbi:MAG: tRNA-specific adenosine deaminase [Chitinophagaceae bacterium]|nr:nucleoside deaminase [Chitinophagaceae bacterium]MCZ2299082.1 nucleoside deaminase [Chitinophagales bacterium]